MDIKPYIAPLIKWWWLLVLSAAVATGSAYLATRDLPNTYQARATLLIGRGVSDPNPSSLEFGLSQQLAGIYAAIAQREPVQNAVLAALNLQELPDYNARPAANGQFIEISVVDTNPVRAQAVANELANQLIRQSPTSPETDRQARQQFVSQQLDDLEAKITETQNEITVKQEELGTKTSASEIADSQQEILGLQTKLAALQTNYANLLASTAQGAINSLTIIEPAGLPTKPIGPKKTLIVLAAAAGGLALAAGAAYLLEFMDDTLRTSEDISRLLQLPVIGHIGEIGRRGKEGGVFVTEQPHSPVAESFRSLRTNLEFAAVDKPLKTILVTSSGEGEGKTTVATNLAAVMAQGGKRVVLLDADMRRPGVNRLLALPNRDGLSDIFRGQVNVSDAVHTQNGDGVGVIVAGDPPPNPTELLGSKKMDHILASLEEVADVVVIDGPPFLLADAWVLSAKVDGVLLVIRPGFTHRDAARTMIEQVNRVGARVVGVALNRLTSAQAAAYGSYAYHISRSDERGRSGPKLRVAGRRSALQSLFRGLRKPAVTESREAVVRRPLEPAPRGIDLSASDRTRTSLELLYAVSHELSAQLDLHELLQRILQITLEGIGASSGSIIVLDSASGVLDGALAYGGKVRLPTAEQLSDTVEQGLAGWVIEQRQAALVPSTRDDERWLRRSWDETNGTSRSALSVPLMSGEMVVGVLTLVHPRIGQFSEDDLALLTAIAAGISFSLANILARSRWERSMPLPEGEAEVAQSMAARQPADIEG